jgi:hypothetical protein
MKSADPLRVALLLGPHRSGGQTRSEVIRLTPPDSIYFKLKRIAARFSCLHPIKRGIAANWLTRIEDFLNRGPMAGLPAWFAANREIGLPAAGRSVAGAAN